MTNTCSNELETPQWGCGFSEDCEGHELLNVAWDKFIHKSSSSPHHPVPSRCLAHAARQWSRFYFTPSPPFTTCCCTRRELRWLCALPTASSGWSRCWRRATRSSWRSPQTVCSSCLTETRRARWYIYYISVDVEPFLQNCYHLVFQVSCQQWRACVLQRILLKLLVVLEFFFNETKLKTSILYACQVHSFQWSCSPSTAH